MSWKYRKIQEGVSLLMSNVIGQVTAVSGATVTIEIDSNLSSLHVRYQGNTYTIGQPGTFLIIGSGHDKHLVLVTTARKGLSAFAYASDQEESFLPKGSFPYLNLSDELTDKTLISGIIVGTIVGKNFDVGVSSYPVVGDDVTLALEQHLKIALTPKHDQHAISIGNFSGSDLPVSLDFDQLLGRHTAIVGTTGCGKSYTVAKLLQTITEDYPGANIIVFDLHGEYQSCFENCRYIRADQLKLPAWLYSFEDLFSLCADLSNQFNIHNQRWAFREGIFKLKHRHCVEFFKDEELANNFDLDAPIPFDFNHLYNYLHHLNTATMHKDGKPAYEEDDQANGERDFFKNKIQYKSYIPYGKEIKKDSPLYGQLDKLVMRVGSRTNDPRYNFMFNYAYPGESNLIDKIKEISGFLDSDQKPITVFDLSYLPSETVGMVVATISRILFQVHFLSERQKHAPSLMVYEEAHNYIPKNGKGSYGEAKISVERIAKEGRKFGIGTIVVSQRPSELSETLLSQCNTFLCMKLSNAQDKSYIEALLPDSLVGLVDILPALPRGHVLAVGQASKMPVRIVVSEIADKSKHPNSDDPKFGMHWSLQTDKRKKPDITTVCDCWIHSKKIE